MILYGMHIRMHGQVSSRLALDVDNGEEGVGGGALGPADIKEELFDHVNVHYRQPEVSKCARIA